ncbi:GDSL-type esterase/lipase family protein [Leptospira wolffii]|uniref:GDSL-type esterase/lipase family protein n=1 Tax=Leptospira wolffii TaxID=409998 RepID=A0ABV5BT59_9LEPT|nr:GDSL-type esterase/lipase family protein [Leptospira wolffii]
MNRKRNSLSLLLGILVAVLLSPATTHAQAPYKLNGPVLIRPFGDSITYGVGFTIDANPNCLVAELNQYICMPPGTAGGGYRGWMTLYSFMQDGIQFTTEGYQSGGSYAAQWVVNTQTHDGYPGWTNELLLPKANYNSFSDITLVHSGTNDMWAIRLKPNPTDQDIDQVANSAGASLFALLNALLSNNKKAHFFVAQIIKVSNGSLTPDYQTINKVIFKYNNYIANNWFNFPPESRARMTLVDMHHTLQASDYSPDGIHPNMYGYRKMACTWIRAIRAMTPNQEDPCSGVLSGQEIKKMAPSKEELKLMNPSKETLELFLKKSSAVK